MPVRWITTDSDQKGIYSWVVVLLARISERVIALSRCSLSSDLSSASSSHLSTAN